MSRELPRINKSGNCVLCPRNQPGTIKRRVDKRLKLGLLRKFIVVSASSLVMSCASMPNETPSPWDFPRRGYDISSNAEQAHLVASMQPCIDYARDTFPEALSRFESGLPGGTDFRVIVFDDQKFNAQIRLWFADDERLEGRITSLHNIKGKTYGPGDIVSVDRSDVIDWYIIYRDRPAEGNLIGKYLLLKQDGLAVGACDPHDIEFQRFRLFARDYSFVPPGVDGWEMREPRDGEDVLMLEKGDGPNELNTLSSARYRFPAISSNQQLVDTTRGFMQYEPEDSDRYRLIEHEIEPYTKRQTTPITFNSLALCALSRQTVADKQALLSDSAERGILIRESRTLVCVHPSESDMAVVLNYSHRYQPGNRDPEFIEKADEVFESIAFKTRN